MPFYSLAFAFITIMGYILKLFLFFWRKVWPCNFYPYGCIVHFCLFFDHLGVLSLGITNLACMAWCAVTPNSTAAY